MDLVPDKTIDLHGLTKQLNIDMDNIAEYSLFSYSTDGYNEIIDFASERVLDVEFVYDSEHEHKGLTENQAVLKEIIKNITIIKNRAEHAIKCCNNLLEGN